MKGSDPRPGTFLPTDPHNPECRMNWLLRMVRWMVFFSSSDSAVVCAVEALAKLVVGKSLQEIVGDFRGFYRLLTSDGQMRWVRLRPRLPDDNCCLDGNLEFMSTLIELKLLFSFSCKQLGPEKGVIHLATAAVLNAVWDLWARAEGKVGAGFCEK